MRTKLLLVVGMVLLAVAPVLAHHSLAAVYDTKQSIMLKGTVTKITWDNPHVHLYLQAMDKGSSDSNWEFELGSPNLLTMTGFKIDTFRRGDYVLVTAYPARDGSRLGYANKVALTTH